MKMVLMNSFEALKGCITKIIVFWLQLSAMAVIAHIIIIGANDKLPKTR